jgi:hypothetical protein
MLMGLENYFVDDNFASHQYIRLDSLLCAGVRSYLVFTTIPLQDTQELLLEVYDHYDNP